MLWVDFNDLSDEKDGFEGRERGFALELEERLHQRANHHWNRLWEGLRDLVDRLDEQVAILVCHSALSAMLVHFGRFDNLTLQELHNFFYISLADEIGEQIKHLLIDLKRDHSVVFNDRQDVIDVVLQDLEVVFAQL